MSMTPVAPDLREALAKEISEAVQAFLANDKVTINSLADKAAERIATPSLLRPPAAPLDAPHECGWTESAKQFAGGMELYRGLLDECAKHLGPAAYTADDGKIHDSPIRLNIPALVADLANRAAAHPGTAAGVDADEYLAAVLEIDRVMRPHKERLFLAMRQWVNKRTPNELIALIEANMEPSTSGTAAPAPVDPWKTIAEAHPPRHTVCVVLRQGVKPFMADACYGMHSPWWVPSIGSADGAFAMDDEDKWAPWAALQAPAPASSCEIDGCTTTPAWCAKHGGAPSAPERGAQP